MSKENTNILNRSYRLFSTDDDQQSIATYQVSSSNNSQKNQKNIDQIDQAVLEHLHEEVVEHFKNSFEFFSEEWTEMKPLGKVKRTLKSAKTKYSVYLLEAEIFEYENTLVTAYFYEHGGEELSINESRQEVIITDGTFIKHEENKAQNREDYTTYKKQKITITHPSLVVLLKRKRVKNEHKRYEHHDVIEVHVRGEERYLIIKDYVESLGATPLFSSSKI